MKRNTVAGGILALGLLGLAGPALAGPMDDARRLMQGGQPEHAYRLLAPDLAAHGQEVDYLYTAAVAAFDAGHPEAAVPLFEAVIRLDPEHGGALLDLGRARLALGLRGQARQAFEAAVRLGPPPAAARVLDKYLAALDEQERALAPTFHAFAEIGLGYDDNINNATAQSQVAVPLFGNALMTLNPSSVGTAAGYSVVTIGADAVKPLDGALGLYGAATLSARNHDSHSEFDSLAPELRGGILFAEGRHFFRAGVFGSQYYLGGRRNREVLGANADWYYVVTPQDRAGVFAQYADYRYADALANEDFQQSLLGGSWSHRLTEATEFSAAFFAAQESAPRRVDGDKDLWAVRATVQHKLSEALQVFGGIGYQESRYDKRNVLFMLTRSDEQYDVNAGVSYRIDQDWSLRGQWTYIDSHSNIALNRFDRNDISFVVRRDF